MQWAAGKQAPPTHFYAAEKIQACVRTGGLAGKRVGGWVGGGVVGGGGACQKKNGKAPPRPTHRPTHRATHPPALPTSHSLSPTHHPPRPGVGGQSSRKCRRHLYLAKTALAASRACVCQWAGRGYGGRGREGTTTTSSSSKEEAPPRIVYHRRGASIKRTDTKLYTAPHPKLGHPHQNLHANTAHPPAGPKYIHLVQVPRKMLRHPCRPHHPWSSTHPPIEPHYSRLLPQPMEGPSGRGWVRGGRGGVWGGV